MKKATILILSLCITVYGGISTLGTNMNGNRVFAAISCHSQGAGPLYTQAEALYSTVSAEYSDSTLCEFHLKTVFRSRSAAQRALENLSDLEGCTAIVRGVTLAVQGIPPAYLELSRTQLKAVLKWAGYVVFAPL